MHIDKDILDKAVELVEPGTAESNGAIVRLLSANESVMVWLKVGVEHARIFGLPSVGTVFQLGLETGIAYQKLIQSQGKEKTHAEQV